MVRVQFDDDMSGCFTVLSGKLDRPPKGWQETSPDRYEPTWEPCRYRRVSTLFRNKQPIILPHCLLYGHPVPCETCFGCADAKPEIKFLPVNDAVQDALDNYEIVDDSFYEDGCPGCFEDTNEIDDPVFGLSQKAKEKLFQKAEQPEPRKRTRWQPCVYRELKTGEKECCPDRYCACEGCPLMGQKVTKRDCRDCEHRAPTKDAARRKSQK